MDETNEIRLLFNLYLAGKCSDKQLHLLSKYFDTAEHQSTLKTLIQKKLKSSQGINIDPHQSTQSILDEIYMTIKKRIDDSDENT